MANPKIARKKRRSKPTETKPARPPAERRIPPPLTPEQSKPVDPGPPTLTLLDVYQLVGSNYHWLDRAPTAEDFAIEALDDAHRTLMLVNEALHQGVDYQLIENAVTNAWFRVGAARDIAAKLARGAS